MQEIIKNEQEANDVLSKMGSSQQNCRVLEAEMEAKIAIITEDYSNRIKIENDRIVESSLMIKRWAEDNRPNDKKTIKLANGTITWKRSSSLNIDNEEALITLLVRLKLGKYITQKLSLNKAILLKEKDGLTKLLEGVHIIENEHLSVKPTVGEVIKFKKEVANAE